MHDAQVLVVKEFFENENHRKTRFTRRDRALLEPYTREWGAGEGAIIEYPSGWGVFIYAAWSNNASTPWETEIVKYANGTYWALVSDRFNGETVFTVPASQNLEAIIRQVDEAGYMPAKGPKETTGRAWAVDDRDMTDTLSFQDINDMARVGAEYGWTLQLDPCEGADTEQGLAAVNLICRERDRPGEYQHIGLTAFLSDGTCVKIVMARDGNGYWLLAQTLETDCDNEAMTLEGLTRDGLFFLLERYIVAMKEKC